MATRCFIQRRLLLLLAVGLWASPAAQGRELRHIETAGSVQLQPAKASSVPENSSKYLRIADDGGTPLQLCECESAVGYPNGLGCEKEGWFISGFEREGTWTSGGGSVPLSHALCCRPCLPEALPAGAEGEVPDGAHPVAVVTLACHPSPQRSWQVVQCDASTNSLLTGFTDARQVANYYDIYYPEGAAQCCTPGLLLSSGDVWALERCNCREAASRTCGGTVTHQLLSGFSSARPSSNMKWVPVEPLQCCSLCLAQHPRNLQDCRDLNWCSDHGICALGTCECSDGYTGPDCSVAPSGGSGDDDDNDDWRIPSWVLWTVFVITFGLWMLSAFVMRVREALRSEGGSDDGGELQRPLLLYGDDTGSVGSVDTMTEGGSVVDGGSDNDGEGGVELVLGPSRRGAGGERSGEQQQGGGEDDGVEMDEGFESGEEGVHGEEGEGWEGEEAEEGYARWLVARPHEQVAGADASPSSPDRPATPQPIATPAPSASPPASPRAPNQPISIPTSPTAAPQADPASTPLAAPASPNAPGSPPAPTKQPPSLEGLYVPPGMEAVCSICVERPIQVALVPCGHTNLCRRCSRKLDKCPFCRADILRRQRLFYSL